MYPIQCCIVTVQDADARPGRRRAETVERLRASVTEPLLLGGQTVSVGLSIGIGSVAGGDHPGDVYERVVREADDAMYSDKARRRHRR